MAELTLAGAFRLSSQKNSGRVAVHAAGGRPYTYEELDSLSNAIAHALLEHCGEKREIVPILMKQDAESLAAILGILKAAKGYSALEASAPLSRQLTLLRDLEAQVVICDDEHWESARQWAEHLQAEQSVKILRFKELQQRGKEARSSEPAVRESDWAWVIPTSGSTGKPKGVLQDQGTAARLCLAYAKLCQLRADDRLSLIHPNLTFTIFGALLSGASLHPFDLKRGGFDALLRWTREQQISFFRAFPTTFRHLMADAQPHDWKSVRLLQLSGESVTIEDVRQFQQHFPEQAELLIHYGSSEGGLGCARRITTHETITTPLSIGRPVAGVEIELWREDGSPAPVGDEGEFALASPYLFPGYWKQPEQSAAVFRSRETDKGSKRFFLTGDLGYVDAGGNFYHTGRKDSQVKLRGFRVELGEIEAALQEHPQVQATAAKLWEGTTGMTGTLALYYVAAGSDPGEAELRRFLSERLPNTIMPDCLLPLSQMPLTSNGKVDRQALAQPAPRRPRLATAYRPAAGPAEEAVLAHFSECLGIEGIGAEDSLFDLGGKSLGALRILSRIEAEFGVSIPPLQFFKEATVAATARHLLAGALAAGDEAEWQDVDKQLERLESEA